MDEHKLAELFRDAVRDAPPPSFDEGDVRSASYRATARRRSSLALGSTMAVVLVFGGVAVSAGIFSTDDKASTSGSAAGAPLENPESAPGETMSPYGLPPDAEPGGQATDRGGPPPKSIPEDSSTQGDETPGSASLSAGGTPTGCGPVDRELAVALAGELPVAAGTQPSPAPGDCPVGAKGASYLVRDGGKYGVFSVVVVPKDSAAPANLGTAASLQVSRNTKTGATVHVVSEPEQGSATPPFPEKLDAVAADIADKY